MAKLTKKSRIEFTNEETQAKFGNVRGTAYWARLTTPDPEYQRYSISLAGEDVENLAKKLDKEMLEPAVKELEELFKGKGKKIEKVEFLKEDNDGNKVIRFSLKETKADGTPNKIRIYDINNKDITDSFTSLIGNGSIVRVQYMVSPYAMPSQEVKNKIRFGLSFKFFAVKIVKLEEYGGSPFKDTDDTDIEDGFDFGIKENGEIDPDEIEF